jgi:hypothetical protein
VAVDEPELSDCECCWPPLPEAPAVMDPAKSRTPAARPPIDAAFRREDFDMCSFQSELSFRYGGDLLSRPQTAQRADRQAAIRGKETSVGGDEDEVVLAGRAEGINTQASRSGRQGKAGVSSSERTQHVATILEHGPRGSRGAGRSQRRGSEGPDWTSWCRADRKQRRRGGWGLISHREAG